MWPEAGAAASPTTGMSSSASTRADGDIVPVLAEAPKANARRKGRYVTATLKAVKEMRPACTEIIICTGLRTRGGQQLWGSVAAGLLCDRKQRG